MCCVCLCRDLFLVVVMEDDRDGITGRMTGKITVMVKNRMLLFGKWSLWFGGIGLAVLVCECDGD